MLTINHILVPVDFTAVAANSYRYALRLADRLSAAVHLIHSLPIAPAIPGHGHMAMDVLPQQYEYADKRMSEFIAEGKDAVNPQVGVMPPVHSSVKTFGLKGGIAAYLEEQNIDLVVMGTHGVQNNWDKFFGTNAAFLVGKVQVPIMILPANVKFQPLLNICFASNLNERDLAGADRVSNAFSVFKPQVNYLHVHLPEDKQTSGALDLFRRAFERPRAGVEATFTTVFAADVTDGIFGHLVKSPHDLLVMVKPERNWWDRMFGHSETIESAGITNLPLLILGEREDQ